MKELKKTITEGLTRRDLLKASGLAVGGFAIAGSAGKAIGATSKNPPRTAVPSVLLSQLPGSDEMRISFFGTWYTPRPNQACNSVFVDTLSTMCRLSGLPVSHFNTGASAADDRYLYFGSVTGLVSVPKGLPLRLRPPSPVRITGVERLVGGSAAPVAPGEIEKRLEFGIDEVLATEFAVLDFTGTVHEYAYRLQATDGWTRLAHRRQLTFVALAPGRYSLEVRGRDAFGRWSTSPQLEFEVVPPFWMTNWFRGLVLAAVALLAFGIHLARLRSLGERNAMLRQLTERLESAKEEERSRISIPVSVIVGQIAHGASFEEILDGYPDLEREDIQQAIEYAAWLTQEQVYSL